ncbi:MAG: DNA-binding transcriptional regulator [Candidatus Magasanikbacteria bacterium]|nr:DNA-binding transcriptional regulator [Candidatus Magasanikbacteria bacterium]NCS72200.1 DNA-binding transcriptional regulator [Candidatus Magasanikbacteria bacterium]
MKTWRTPKFKKFAKALLLIESQKDMENFLRDVATLEELDALSSRWEVAQMIDKGIAYRTIAEKTGVSTATITRIAHWLRHGEGGYQATLDTSH